MMQPWLDAAYKELGVGEIPGDDHNPRIIDYHAHTTYKATADEVPWCSAFVCCMLEENGVHSTISAAAKSYLLWGVTLEHPTEGCVAILRRDTDKFHVGFYIDEDETTVHILGGNQGDKVSIARFKKELVIAYKYPRAVDFKSNRAVRGPS